MEKKVTLKNIKDITITLENELKKALSCYEGHNGNKYAYKTVVEHLDFYGSVNVLPTDTQIPFITKAALASIIEVYENFEFKEKAFYGIEAIEYEGHILPSVTLYIQKG